VPASGDAPPERAASAGSPTVYGTRVPTPADAPPERAAPPPGESAPPGGAPVSWFEMQRPAERTDQLPPPGGARPFDPSPGGARPFDPPGGPRGFDGRPTRTRPLDPSPGAGPLIGAPPSGRPPTVPATDNRAPAAPLPTAASPTAAPPTMPPGALPPGAGPGRPRRRRRGLWLGLGAVLVVLVLVAAGIVALRPPVFFGSSSASSPTQPPGLAAPPGPVLAIAGSDAPVPTAADVAAALHGPVAVSQLGDHVAVRVVDAVTGQQLYAQGGTDPTTPASTMKLATTTALLALRGPGYQLQTRAVAGPTPGSVVIIGGGDPTLAVGPKGSYPGAGRLDDLANQVKRALGSTVPTKVIYDLSLFSGPNTGPDWESDDVDAGGQSARITALMTDGGRTDPANLGLPSPRYPRPDLTAAQDFARLLGVPASAVVAGTAPAGSQDATAMPAAGNPAGDTPPPPGTTLGVVKSAPLVSILEQMLATSDNTVAEMMARQVALALGKPASFAGGAAAVTQELTTLGLPLQGVRIVDGSGLSHDNKLTPALLTGALALAAQANQPQLHSLFTGLPVAGYSGTLAQRFRTPAANVADGDVRAKTGTLTGVHTLAGYVTDTQGRLLVFAVMADKVTGAGDAAEDALDQIGTALAGVS
jgi:D-alanyl-D-alanine carboxypeptidase/D-alanyl-D-alanine-endopeptidase (penicillin-binding protein 4)